MKPRIRLVVERTDGRRSSIEIDGDSITSAMLDAAEDLIDTLTTGERPPPKGLYDLCATAFGTTREDAKKRVLGALYGQRGRGQKVEGRMKITSYFLGAGPHAAERVAPGDGTVQIRMFDGKIVGYGLTAEDAALHLADQLRAIAQLVEGHEGVQGDSA